MRRIVLLVAMLAMLAFLAAPALAAAPENDHNCYGVTTSYYGSTGAFRDPSTVGFPYEHYGPLTRDTARSYPGAEGEGQRGLADALANCGG
jgi:hypothetical protein